MKFLTFDIEDWFHILDNPKTKFPSQWESFPKRVDIGLNIILDLCSKHEIKATFFCLGWIAEKYPELIKKIEKAGHTIGTHGYAHQLIYDQTPNEFKSDLKKSISLIESIIEKKVTAYRAPGFSITKNCLWAFDIMSECGIEYDSSIFSASRAHGGFKEIPLTKPYKLITPSGRKITELPITARNVLGRPIIFAGGGYFRLIPFFLLKKWFRESDYTMTYFHPRDFDSKQPFAPGLNLARKFKSYYGLSSTEKKLNHILESNNFMKTFQGIQTEDSFYLNSI